MERSEVRELKRQADCKEGANQIPHCVRNDKVTFYLLPVDTDCEYNVDFCTTGTEGFARLPHKEWLSEKVRAAGYDTKGSCHPEAKRGI